MLLVVACAESVGAWGDSDSELACVASLVPSWWWHARPARGTGSPAVPQFQRHSVAAWVRPLPPPPPPGPRSRAAAWGGSLAASSCLCHRGRAGAAQAAGPRRRPPAAAAQCAHQYDTSAWCQWQGPSQWRPGLAWAHRGCSGHILHCDHTRIGAGSHADPSAPSSCGSVLRLAPSRSSEFRR
jgi:hypothetical protein